MDEFSQRLAASALVDGQHFTLPGHGTLEGVYVAARIDHAAKLVEPPHLEIRWTTIVDERVQSFAEMLQRSGATTAEAETMQRSWLNALDAGETIHIGDLGQLFFDPTTALVGFLPNGSALQKAYWGGGAVELEPLAKRAAPVVPAAPALEPVPSPPPARTRSKVQRLVPYLAAAAVILVGILIYSLADRQVEEQNQNRGQVIPVNQDRLNRSPREAILPAHAAPHEEIGPVEERSIVPGQPSDVNTYSDELPAPGALTFEDESAAFDPAALAGEGGNDDSYQTVEIEAVVVLGSFGNPQNASKLTQKIVEAGLIPYVDQPGQLTRVGVTFSARNEEDIARMLQRMRSDFNPKAWLLE